MLFNKALGKVVRSVQRESSGIGTGRKISILGFTDDLNLIGDYEESIA